MNEFKVGLLALATLATVVVMSLKITTNQSGLGEHVTYRTVLQDASGIFEKTPIKVAGINAGRIVDISLDGINAIVTFEVKKNIKVPVGPRLRINTVGLLGDKYLELVLTRNTEIVPENGMIIAEDGPGIQKIIKQADAILRDVKAVTEGLKSAVAPEGKESPVKVILEDVKVAVANARDVTSSLKRMINGNEERINSLVDNFDQFSQRLNNELDKDDPESSISDVKEVLANAKEMTADLKKLIADVKAGKGTLGKVLVEEEISDQVKETLSGVQKIVGKVNDLRSELHMFTGANTDWGNETYLNLKIWPSPERFYLLGIVSAPYGFELTREITDDTNGVRTETTQRIRKKNYFRFNVQGGRKIHNWTLRGGIIESSGGLGVEYDWSTVGTSFAAEVFDYRDNIGPNFRLSSDIQLWSVLYGRVAAEDLLKADLRSYSVFLGLKFTDEDLKGLLGLFL